MITQRDLLLVPFPFSDQSGKKVRPVVVVSNDWFNDSSEDVIVVGVTSNLSKSRYSVNLSSNDLEEGKLMDLCCIKVESILKVEKSLVIKKIGKLSNKKFNEVHNILQEIIRTN